MSRALRRKVSEVIEITRVRKFWSPVNAIRANDQFAFHARNQLKYLGVLRFNRALAAVYEQERHTAALIEPRWQYSARWLRFSLSLLNPARISSFVYRC